MLERHTKQPDGIQSNSKLSERQVAEHLLGDMPLSPTDATRLILELIEGSPQVKASENQELLGHCREVIQLGLRAHEEVSSTVSFEEAVRLACAHKVGVRERTLTEVMQITRRVMRICPEWGNMGVRQIDATLCQQTIEKTFRTVPTQKKAKRVLHAIFAHALRNGWCSSNPLDLVTLPPHRESPIHALHIKQILALLETSLQPEHYLCAPALGILLWTGVRPYELTRLRRSNINFEDRVITVPAAHSKTGGARQVTIHPPLYHWLRKHLRYNLPDAPIVPRAWVIRWTRLRRAAGFDTWVPDILRHTYASYHLKYFCNLQVLQVEMGHGSLELLRTRYLGMENVSMRAAKIFWEYGVPRRARSTE